MQILYLALAASFQVDRAMPEGVPWFMRWANLQQIVSLHAAKILLDRALTIFGDVVGDPSKLSSEWDFDTTEHQRYFIPEVLSRFVCTIVHERNEFP